MYLPVGLPSVVDIIHSVYGFGGCHVYDILHPKRGSSYHRSHVPRRLRSLLNGRAEVWRSLETTDKDEARARSAQWDARIQRLFQTLRTSGERMTKDEREQLAAQWLESELEYAEDCRALGGLVSDAHRESQLDGLDIMSDEVDEALMSNDFRKIERDADQLLRSAGLPQLEHDSVEFARLCRRLLVARQEYIQVERERWNGVYRPVVHAAASASAPSTKHKTPTTPLFTEVVQKFFVENARSPRTDVQVRAELDRFVEALGGDKPVGSIVKADCRTYKDSMMQARKLGPATIIKHLSNLSGIFKWCEGQGYITEGSNPVRGLPPNKKAAKKAAQDRRPFTDDELLQVFGSPDYISQRESNLRGIGCLCCVYLKCVAEKRPVNSRSVIFKKRQGFVHQDQRRREAWPNSPR